MSNQLYDDTFTPFTITDGRCVVAPEAEWARIEAAATAGRRMLVGDVFQEWDGPVVAADGWQVWNHDDKWSAASPYPAPIPFTTADIRRRLSSMIDRTAATWCVETRYPENVGRMMPVRHGHACSTGGCSHENVLDCASITDRQIHPNVHLYAGPIHTQADADVMIPALLRCPAAMRGLVVTPREEMDFEEVPVGMFGPLRPHGEMDGMLRINHVVIRGDSEPMHPAHVRSIVEQCKAAGVPCYLEWGEWAPVNTVQRVPSAGLAYLGNGDHETTMSRVGRARSGAMLDGKEWRQLPEVTR